MNYDFDTYISATLATLWESGVYADMSATCPDPTASHQEFFDKGSLLRYSELPFFAGSSVGVLYHNLAPQSCYQEII